MSVSRASRLIRRVPGPTTRFTDSAFVDAGGIVAHLDADGANLTWISAPPGADLGLWRAAWRPWRSALAETRHFSASAPPGLRVVGALGEPLLQAREELQQSPGEACWLDPADLYPLLAGPGRDLLGRVPAAVDLVARSLLPDRPPLRATPRMRAALDLITRSLLRPSRRAVLLKGVAGVGKSCLVDLLCRDVAAMRVPGRLQGTCVAALGTELFLPALSGEEEQSRSRARLELARMPVIWVIDEAARLVDRHGNDAAVDNLLLFIDHGARVICVSDRTGHLEKREAFVRRVTPCYLAPAGNEETRAITGHLAAFQERRSGLAIEPQVTSRAVALSVSLPFAQPHAALDLLGHAVARAEARGRDRLTASDLTPCLAELLAQGDPPPTPVETAVDFVSRMREAGMCGQDELLQRFGERLVATQQRRPGARDQGVRLAALLAGPPGCGKSTFCQALGSVLLSSPRKVLTLRGGAYSERHAAAQALRGAPPSFVGYEQGSPLAHFVRQAPDGILVLEEPELAHPSLQPILLEILDGAFETADGCTVRTAGLIVLLATNAGWTHPTTRPGFAVSSRPDGRPTGVTDELRRLLDPRLLSRFADHDGIHQLPPLDEAALADVIHLEMDRASQSLGLSVQLSDELVRSLVARAAGEREQYGARTVLGLFRRQVLFPLERLIRAERAEDLEVTIDAQGEIHVLGHDREVSS